MHNYGEASMTPSLIAAVYSAAFLILAAVVLFKGNSTAFWICLTISMVFAASLLIIKGLK